MSSKSKHAQRRHEYDQPRIHWGIPADYRWRHDYPEVGVPIRGDAGYWDSDLRKRVIIHYSITKQVDAPPSQRFLVEATGRESKSFPSIAAAKSGAARLRVSAARADFDPLRRDIAQSHS